MNFDVTALTGIVGTAVGAYAVYRFGVRQMNIKRVVDFREKQLSEFYGPMAALRQRVAADWDVIYAIHERALEASSITEAQRNALTSYDLERLSRVIQPIHQRMLDLFTDKYHLAAPETRVFYKQFAGFVDFEERVNRDSLPEEVASALPYQEVTLEKFYDHLEHQLTVLQRELSVLAQKDYVR